MAITESLLAARTVDNYPLVKATANIHHEANMHKRKLAADNDAAARDCFQNLARSIPGFELGIDSKVRNAADSNADFANFASNLEPNSEDEAINLEGVGIDLATMFGIDNGTYDLHPILDLDVSMGTIGITNTEFNFIDMLLVGLDQILQTERAMEANEELKKLADEIQAAKKAAITTITTVIDSATSLLIDDNPDAFRAHLRHRIEHNQDTQVLNENISTLDAIGLHNLASVWQSEDRPSQELEPVS